MQANTRLASTRIPIKVIQDTRRLEAHRYHSSIGDAPVAEAARQNKEKEILDSKTISEIGVKMRRFYSAFKSFTPPKED